MPRMLSLAPIDYADWHARLVTVRPWASLDGAEAAVIEDIGKDFVVLKPVTGVPRDPQCWSVEKEIAARLRCGPNKARELVPYQRPFTLPRNTPHARGEYGSPIFVPEDEEAGGEAGPAARTPTQVTSARARSRG